GGRGGHSSSSGSSVSIACGSCPPAGTCAASGAGLVLVNAGRTAPGEAGLGVPPPRRERRTLGGLPGTVQSLAISPDGTRIAAGGGDSTPKVEGWLTVCDAASGQRLWTCTESAVTVLSGGFSPDGQSPGRG